MKVTVQVVLHADDDTQTVVVREAFTLTRKALEPDTVGLQLQEAKDLLAAVQDTLVEHQVNTALSSVVACPDCGNPRRHKDSRRIVMRTLFGTLRLDSPRWRTWRIRKRSVPASHARTNAPGNGYRRHRFLPSRPTDPAIAHQSQSPRPRARPADPSQSPTAPTEPGTPA